MQLTRSNNVFRQTGLWVALASLLLHCGQKMALPYLVSTVPAQGNADAGTMSDTTFPPENMIAHDAAFALTARYTNPSTHYTHGILGDTIEGGGLLKQMRKAGIAAVKSGTGIGLLNR